MKKNIQIISLIILISFGLFGCKNQSTDKDIKTLLGTKISQTKIDNFIDQQMDSLNMPALSIAIINDGEVVYHSVKGLANKEKGILADNKSIFEGASISKSIFGFFVMTYVEDGIIDLDKPLYQYMPYPDIEEDERYEKITARIILSHRSGFPNWRDDYPDKKLFIQFEPGTEYHYSGEGYQYLAKVLKHLLKTNWAGLEDEFQKRVVIPFGMEHSKFIQNDYIKKHKVQPYDKNGNWVDKNADEWWRIRDSVFVAPTTLHSESINFSKWMIGMMNEKGLTKASYEELFRTHSKINDGFFLSDSYSLGFNNLSLLKLKTLYNHNGNNTGFSSYFMFDKEKKWGIVYFTNSKFGDAFGTKLIYDLLLVGSKSKQITIVLTLALAIILLVINLLLIMFKGSSISKLRKINLGFSAFVSISTILVLILMLLNTMNLSIVYGILIIITIALSINSLKNTINVWRTSKKHKFELVFQSILVFGIIISAFMISII